MFSNKIFWRFAPLYLLALTAAVSVSLAGLATALVLLAAAVRVLTAGERCSWPGRPVLVALGALIGCYFLATLLSLPYPHHWQKFGEELWIKLLLIGIPLAAGNHPKQVERVLKTALILGGLAGTYALVQYYLGVDLIRDRSIYRPQFGHNAVSGFFGHHLSYAGQALIFLVLTAAWALDRGTVRRSLWLLPLVVVLAASLLLSFARSAVFGAVTGLLVLVLVQTGRARWWGLAGVLSGLAGALAVTPLRVHLLQSFQLDGHLTRLNLLRSSWAGIRANPLLGYGPGNFEALLAEHQVPGHYETLAHSHNDLVMHGVNAGIPGLLAALALLGVICWVMLNARRARSPYRWVFTGALAVQVGITVAGFFQVYQTDDEVEILLYFVLGCAVALAGPIVQVKSGEKSEV